jgi:hypothetical protein
LPTDTTEDEKLALAALLTSTINEPAPAFATVNRDPISGAMHLDLSDEETAALTQELHDLVESDRYPLSPRQTRSHEASARAAAAVEARHGAQRRARKAEAVKEISFPFSQQSLA